MHFLIICRYLYLFAVQKVLCTPSFRRNSSLDWTTLNIVEHWKPAESKLSCTSTPMDMQRLYLKVCEQCGCQFESHFAVTHYCAPDAQTWAKSTNSALNGLRILVMMSGSENVSPCSTKTSSLLQMPPDSTRCRGTPYTRLSRRTTSPKTLLAPDRQHCPWRPGESGRQASRGLQC